MKGYTAIEGPLTAEVPLASYMLYNEFKPSDVAYFQKFYDLFTEKGIFEKKVVVDRPALQGLSHGRRPPPSAAAAPWTARRPAPPRRRRRSRRGARCCPLIGPLVLFIVWDLVGARSASSSRSCCRRRPTPSPRWSPAWPAGRCCSTSRSRLAHAAGLPDRRGHRRAAGRAARQQREGLPQRRVPDRLLPLDAVVGADPAVPADLRRVGHQQGGDRGLRRAADRGLQQRLRRDQRAQAARDGGAA